MPPAECLAAVVRRYPGHAIRINGCAIARFCKGCGISFAVVLLSVGAVDAVARLTTAIGTAIRLAIVKRATNLAATTGLKTVLL